MLFFPLPENFLDDFLYFDVCLWTCQEKYSFVEVVKTIVDKTKQSRSFQPNIRAMLPTSETEVRTVDNGVSIQRQQQWPYSYIGPSPGMSAVARENTEYRYSADKFIKSKAEFHFSRFDRWHSQ